MRPQFCSLGRLWSTKDAFWVEQVAFVLISSHHFWYKAIVPWHQHLSGHTHEHSEFRPAAHILLCLYCINCAVSQGHKHKGLNASFHTISFRSTRSWRRRTGNAPLLPVCSRSSIIQHNDALGLQGCTRRAVLKTRSTFSNRSESEKGFVQSNFPRCW